MYKKTLIIANEHVSGPFYLLTIQDMEMAEKSKPGQFYMITPYTSDIIDSELYLKRPISIFDVNTQTGEISFYYQVVGKGTTSLSKMKQGQELEILGPLGRPFKTNFENQKLLLIGAGVGIAPFKYLYDTLKEKNEVHIIFAGRNKNSLKITRYFDFPKNVYYCSDDGSLGQKDNAVSLASTITQVNKENPFSFIYACGPTPVLTKIGKLSEKLDIEYQLSLESYMACGVRACMACSIKTKMGIQQICSMGPIFDGKNLILEEL